MSGGHRWLIIAADRRNEMRYLIAGLLVMLLLEGSQAGAAAPAESGPCRKLTAPVTDEERKYAVTAEVYGTVAFASIDCAVYWRNKEFCATEMATFDVTAKVIDYLSGEEVKMADAYFVLDAPGKKRVVSFASKSAAEEFVARTGGGAVVDYYRLNSTPSR
jgi:hypothetical protein